MLFNKASCRKRKQDGSTMRLLSLSKYTDPIYSGSLSAVEGPDYRNMLTDPDSRNVLTEPDYRNALTEPIYSGSLSAVEGPDSLTTLSSLAYSNLIIQELPSAILVAKVTFGTGIYYSKRFRHLLFIFYKRCIIRALCINQSYLTH